MKYETSVQREMTLQQLRFVPKLVVSREEEMKYEVLTVKKSFLFLCCFSCPLNWPLS